MMLILLFMAVISTGSAELVGVSSLVSYDIYREYFNKEATGDDILRISRYTILSTGVLMGALSVLLNQAGISLNWVYLFMGTLIGSAVYPIWCCLSWDKATSQAALCAASGGQVLALTAWLVTCQVVYGEITISNLGENPPMLAGNMTAIFSSCLIMRGVTLFKPDQYKWEELNKKLHLVEQDLSGLDSNSYDEATLDHAKNWIVKWGVALTLLLVVAWPLLTIPAGAFPKPYFVFWIVISFIWCFVATIIMTTLPVWEDRDSIWAIISGVLGLSSFSSTPKADLELKESTMNVLVSAGDLRQSE